MLRILSLLLLLPLWALAQSAETGNTTEVQPDGETRTEFDESAESLVIERIEREPSVDENRSVLSTHIEPVGIGTLLTDLLKAGNTGALLNPITRPII